MNAFIIFVIITVVIIVILETLKSENRKNELSRAKREAAEREKQKRAKELERILAKERQQEAERKRLLAEAQKTVLEIFTKVVNGMVKVGFYYSTPPPEEVKAEIKIYRTKDSALSSHTEHEKRKDSEVFVRTFERYDTYHKCIADDNYPREKNEKGKNHYYYNVYVFIENYSTPVFKNVVMVVVDSEHYAYIAKVKKETHRTKTETELFKARTESATVQKNYIEAEVDLRQVEAETGVYTQLPSERNQVLTYKRKNRNKITYRPPVSENGKKLDVTDKKYLEELLKSKQKSEKAIAGFSENIRGIKSRIQNVEERFEMYELIINDGLQNNKLLAQIDLTSIVEEIDQSYGAYRESKNIDYELLEEEY